MLQHLVSEEAPFFVRRRSSGPDCHDEQLHRQAFARAPKAYALWALRPEVQSGQRARVAYVLLSTSRKAMSAETRQLLDRVVAVLLATLPATQVLQVFMALKRSRANHQHTRKAMVRYLLNHPRFTSLVKHRRPAVRDALEHALGRNVARGCLKMLTRGEQDEAYVRRHLWRHLDGGREQVAIALEALAGGELPDAGDEHQLTHRPLEKTVKTYDKTITATNRGDIAATLVHIYRGDNNVELRAGLERFVAEASQKLPRFGGRVAIVLDASASTRGYGEREFCGISQSMALQLVVQACVSDVRAIFVGGSDELAMPAGSTDLASALIEALQTEPDVVLVVTDGYENQVQGDLDRVIRSLPAAGVQTPILVCLSAFTRKDDLALRQVTSAAPQMVFWHQDDLESVILSGLSMARRDDASLNDFLLAELGRAEKEVQSWLQLH